MRTTDESPKSTIFSANETGRTMAIDLMEHLVIPAFVLDAQRRVIIWNRACERLTGIAAASVVGASEHWRGFYKSPRPCLADLIIQGRVDQIDAFYPEHGSVIDPRDGLYAENWCVIPNLGMRLYLATDAVPIYDHEGTLLAVIETLRDMTVQKLAQEALQEASNQDGLTGIVNRHSFEETLKIEWRRAMRDVQSLSLLMIDIDHFKSYNDIYGHAGGDECLKRIAGDISGQMHRAGDVVARYGGEEFAVILPNNSLAGAIIVAERVRASIEMLALPFAGSALGHVSVSIGAASVLVTPIADSWELISTADAALFDAKQGGRNRIAAMQVEALAAATGKC